MALLSASRLPGLEAVACLSKNHLVITTTSRDRKKLFSFMMSLFKFEENCSQKPSNRPVFTAHWLELYLMPTVTRSLAKESMVIGLAQSPLDSESPEGGVDGYLNKTGVFRQGRMEDLWICFK